MGLCWGPLHSEADWQFEWMPSHNTEADAASAGVSPADWLGNAKADEAAKAKAKEADLSPQLLQRWADHQAATEAVWRLIAESQVAHLACRARRRDGTAAKSRKRKAPARPCRKVRRRAAAGGAPRSSSGGSGRACSGRPTMGRPCCRQLVQAAADAAPEEPAAKAAPAAPAAEAAPAEG